MRDRTFDFNELAKRWPSAIVARHELSRFTGGLLSKRYAANLDAQGIGIRGRMRCGNKIFYPVTEVIRFLKGRSKSAKQHESEIEA